MSNVYTTKSTSRQSADVIEDFELSRTPAGNRRLMLKNAKVVENPNNADARLKITLVYQSKSKNGTWQDEDAPSRNKLKPGEAIRLPLDSATTLKLYERLQSLYAIASGGVRPGEKRLVVGEEDEVIQTDTARARSIKTLLGQDYSESMWNKIVSDNPTLATRLALAQIQTQRQEGLKRFEHNIDKQQDENWWQKFFEHNTWIFGYGLKYQILTPVANRPSYDAPDVHGKGNIKGDFLVKTGGDLRFTVLVEIKKPDTPLLDATNYRPSVPAISRQIIGGISQLQSQCRRWEMEGSQNPRNTEALSKEHIFTVQPKGILVAGRTSSISDIDRRNTFELFRRNIANPEVITFDELLERAKFIVTSTGLTDRGLSTRT